MKYPDWESRRIERVADGESFFKWSDMYWTGKREYISSFATTGSSPIWMPTFWGWLVRLSIVSGFLLLGWLVN